MCRHRSGYFAPAHKYVALLGGSLFGGDGSAISHVNLLVHLAVHLVDELVSVGCKATRHLHIACRHRGRYFTPAAESVTLLGGSLFGGDGSAISHVYLLVHLTVHLVDELVSVHRKATRHLHIICRHCGRYFAPAAESVAFLFGSGLGGDGSAVSNLCSLVHLAVHLVDEFVSVHRKATRHLHIVCRHGGRYFAPAAESVTLLGRIGLGGDSITIGYRHHCVRHAVHIVDKVVGVDLPLRGECEVACWHGGGQFLVPAHEGIALACGSVGSRDGGVVVLRDGRHLAATVGVEGDGVLVYYKLTRHLHIVRRHGERQSCPAAERVALAFGVFDGGECCAVWHLLSIVFHATDYVCQRVAACSVEHQRTAGSAAQTLRLEGDVTALGLQVKHLARVGVAQAQNDVLALRLIAAHAQVEPLRLVLGLHLGRAAAFVAHKGPHLVVAEVGYRRAVKHDVGVERHVIFVVVRIDRPWRLAAAVLGACAEHAQQQCGYEQPQAFRVYMCHVCVCIYCWLTGLRVNGLTGKYVLHCQYADSVTAFGKMYKLTRQLINSSTRSPDYFTTCLRTVVEPSSPVVLIM